MPQMLTGQARGTTVSNQRPMTELHISANRDLTLKQAALKLAFVTEEFDRVVDPAKMVKPYVAATE